MALEKVIPDYLGFLAEEGGVDSVYDTDAASLRLSTAQYIDFVSRGTIKIQLRYDWNNEFSEEEKSAKEQNVEFDADKFCERWTTRIQSSSSACIESLKKSYAKLEELQATDEEKKKTAQECDEVVALLEKTAKKLEQELRAGPKEFRSKITLMMNGKDEFMLHAEEAEFQVDDSADELSSNNAENNAEETEKTASENKNTPLNDKDVTQAFVNGTSQADDIAINQFIAGFESLLADSQQERAERRRGYANYVLKPSQVQKREGKNIFSSLAYGAGELTAMSCNAATKCLIPAAQKYVTSGMGKSEAKKALEDALEGALKKGSLTESQAEFVRKTYTPNLAKFKIKGAA